MTDVLTLGGIQFDHFSTPTEMMGGGRQAMVVHKLPGGNRVIDTLGPDEANIVWKGFFFSDDAYDKILTLDGMRASGAVYSLVWGGQFRSVIIEQFIYKAIFPFPLRFNYDISLIVYQNPSLGSLAAVTGTIGSIVLADLLTAIGLTE